MLRLLVRDYFWCKIFLAGVALILYSNLTYFYIGQGLLSKK
ncbi:hypothetical protein THA_1761 [Thermosipho africanus TCF52B]|uniref:Uncharacterized protein n=1 Tax=Thermosipho africanus (strain TCF52B) TaxID=484019 RepID=B7IDW5_THEAB|nr:hypothetical protein THA_1761 [Thermosipho africanus TCF52B]